MTTRLRLLDLFCGAGGCAMGYHRAGFDVTGVDLAPQPRYPFEFIQGDALQYVVAHGHEFDAIHASPPCQGYSATRHLPWLAGREYPLLIAPTRKILHRIGRPYVIENVDRAPLISGVMLCGLMFGGNFYKHRKFESNVMILAPSHPRHIEVIGSGRIISTNTKNTNGFIGLGAKASDVRDALGVDWMTAKELRDAIPPAYTEYIGRQVMSYLEPAQRAPYLDSEVA